MRQQSDIPRITIKLPATTSVPQAAQTLPKHQWGAKVRLYRLSGHIQGANCSLAARPHHRLNVGPPSCANIAETPAKGKGTSILVIRSHTGCQLFSCSTPAPQTQVMWCPRPGISPMPHQHIRGDGLRLSNRPKMNLMESLPQCRSPKLYKCCQNISERQRYVHWLSDHTRGESRLNCSLAACPHHRPRLCGAPGCLRCSTST